MGQNKQTEGRSPSRVHMNCGCGDDCGNKGHLERFLRVSASFFKLEKVDETDSEGGEA